MAKIQTLKEIGSDVAIYPETSASAVYFPDGRTAEQKHNELLEKLRGNADSFTLSDDLSMNTDGELSVTEKAKRSLFIEMWNARGDYNTGSGQYESLVIAKYDPENTPEPDHPFYINHLWLTYPEAVTVMGCTDSIDQLLTVARTYFPARNRSRLSLQSAYNYCSSMETVRLLDYNSIRFPWSEPATIRQVSNTSEAFIGCVNLREVIDPIHIAEDSGNTHFRFTGELPNLETFWVGHVFNSFVFNAPKLRLECWAYMIEHAANTTAITITVHPDAYARLTDELIEQAADKQITFTTTITTE